MSDAQLQASGADCPRFTIVGPRRAKCVRAYDADTLTCNFALRPGDGELHQFQVRVAGIDAPEIKGATPEERALAARARDLVHSLCLHRVLDLTCEGLDKYGRVLARVSVDGADVGQRLIAEGLAKPYAGGRKEAWV